MTKFLSFSLFLNIALENRGNGGRVPHLRNLRGTSPQNEDIHYIFLDTYRMNILHFPTFSK